MGKKPKPPAVIDALSTEKMNKDQLEERIICLREELDRVREEKSYFQLERDRVKSLWETSQRDLDQVQRDINQRHREREEAEECHRLEISVYKQKLTHVLSEQHSAVSKLKIDKTSAQILDQNQHTEQEVHLVQERSRLQSTLREKEQLSQRSLRTLQQKQQVELMELRHVYVRKVRDVEERFRASSLSLSQQTERRLLQEVSEVEEAAKKKISEMQSEQRRLMRATEKNHITVSNRLESEHLKLTEQWSSLEKKLSRVQRELTEAKADKQRMKEELDKGQRLLPELKSQVQQQQRNKELEKRGREREKQLDKELRGIRMENILLQQAFRKLQQERDQLKASQFQQVLDVQRRNVLKEERLHKKLKARRKF